LELKVDPQKCFVGEMGKIASISSLTLAGKISEERATEIIAEEYWNELITLEDFLRWYRKPEVGTDGFVKDEDQYRGGEASAIGFCVLEHAPKQLPWSFNFPEILIPGDIQQEYIKLVK
jgi:hypothetical protein